MEGKPGKSSKGKKVWKGEKRGGPAPARHIPWPEIFKHHISIVEGHLRMMEMIQKHTSPGTGNHESITTIVKRCHEMLYQTKDSTRSFVPPKNQREEVPLGSSSLSMYPGYSPADIKYGQAAGEAGQAIGDIRKRGEKWEGPSNGAEYQAGQAHGAKRRMLFAQNSTESAGNEGAAKVETAIENTEEAAQEAAGGENPYFTIDTNPTPVVVQKSAPKASKKRALDDDKDEGFEKEKSKKAKKETNDTEIVLETEDISAEVEARLKAKEEKAKAKKEKKRRRSSTDETEQVIKKSKKDKPKKREAESGAEGSADGDGTKKKKKKSESSD